METVDREVCGLPRVMLERKVAGKKIKCHFLVLWATQTKFHSPLFY